MTKQLAGLLVAVIVAVPAIAWAQSTPTVPALPTDPGSVSQAPLTDNMLECVETPSFLTYVVWEHPRTESLTSPATYSTNRHLGAHWVYQVQCGDEAPIQRYDRTRAGSDRICHDAPGYGAPNEDHLSDWVATLKADGWTDACTTDSDRWYFHHPDHGWTGWLDHHHAPVPTTTVPA